ncbi:hypothetical protein Tco_1286602 [Tanacetum coccineum]
MDISVATREELLLLSKVFSLAGEIWESRLRVVFQLLFSLIKMGAKHPSISEHSVPDASEKNWDGSQKTRDIQLLSYFEWEKVSQMQCQEHLWSRANARILVSIAHEVLGASMLTPHHEELDESSESMAADSSESTTMMSEMFVLADEVLGASVLKRHHQDLVESSKNK